jgi:uncharacterized protein (UPF0248 family)
MIPIQQLLSRIQWDPEFGKVAFVIGYYDRILKEIVRVDLAEVVITPGDHQAVKIMAPDGVFHTVPLHRIREVYRDKQLIWRRPEQPGDAS